ncbi:MAG TPA: hypothetical protein VI895_07025 [Bdellovibrionota bacterium]|nr:hypothetical protein [Bdellovibrionota bacterium]
MTDFKGLLRCLSERRVEFIIVGGVAATAHGSSQLTVDLDIVYRRTSENIQRLVDSLQPQAPYLRGAPPGLPFQWDSETIRHGLNFTLTTKLGDIDLLGEIVGGGKYEDLAPHSISLNLYGVSHRCLNLEKLIEVKRAAGRPKDLERLAELEALLEERKK